MLFKCDVEPNFSSTTKKGSTLSEPRNVSELIESWNAGLKRKLEECIPCDNTTIVERLLHYETLIKTTFVPWMSQTWVGCHSKIARTACADNLLCEIGDDHPAMLSRYVDQADNRKTTLVLFKNVRRVRKNFDRLNVLIDPEHPLSGLIVMMLLENASLVFIPEMRRWGEVRGFTDFEYVNKHGIADVTHADEFRRAVEAEVSEANFNLEHMIDTYTEEVECVTRLLLDIFGKE